jgi:hypothetical protein
MADTKAILSTLEEKIVDLAKSTFTDFTKDAITDGKELLATIKDDLIRRTELLEQQKITPGEFSDLMLGDKGLVQMAALTQKGLALARVDAFKTGVFNLIIGTVTSLI